jgi:hypothetical protein
VNGSNERPSVATVVCSQVDRRLAEARSMLSADAGASPVLIAVVDEFARKFEKTRQAIERPGGPEREAVVELEQAADSARWAAEADPGAKLETRTAVVLAHDTICWFKATGEPLPEGAA